MNNPLTESQKLQEAKDSLANLLKAGAPTIGIALGSGLGKFVEQVKGLVSVPYAEIPHFPQSKGGVQGHDNRLVVGGIGKTRVVILQGRVHPYQGISLKEAIFPTRLMIKMGANTLILTHVVGGISQNLAPGEFVAVRDHIASHDENPLVGPNEDDLGLRFPDMSQAYDPGLIALAMQCALQERVILHRGVSVFHKGPCYETPAEIQQMRRWDADVATMSTVYEVIAARHMGKKVLDIALVVNMGAGVLQTKLKHEEVIDAADRQSGQFARLMTAIVKEIAAKK